MVTIEQVEKLREKTGVSYEEAKLALEETKGDLLEAVILLEKLGRVKTPNSGYYNSANNQQQTNHNGQYSEQNDNSKQGSSFTETLGKMFRWLGKLVHKGNTNSLIIKKAGEHIMAIPITALVLLLIFAFWLIIPLMIISLFFGFRYWFEGPELGKPSVNNAMDKVADVAEDIKKDFSKGANNN